MDKTKYDGVNMFLSPALLKEYKERAKTDKEYIRLLKTYKVPALDLLEYQEIDEGTLSDIASLELPIRVRICREILREDAEKILKGKEITRDLLRTKMTYPWSDVQKLFGDLTTFRNYIKHQIDPEAIPFTRDYVEDTRKDPPRKVRGTFFITGVVPGQFVHEEFLASAQTFCKVVGATPIFLGMRGLTNKDIYDPKLQSLIGHFTTEFVFNSNLEAKDLHLDPQRKIPLTGFKRTKKNSFIVAHTRQQMIANPVSQTGLPRTQYSTGVITRPNYRYTESGATSHQDHVLGGLIVEIENDQYFHIRQIQADEKGGFYDIAGGQVRYFCGNKVTKSNALAFVLGDYHSGYQDEQAVKVWSQIAKEIKPEYTLLHDLFNGSSISHHNANKTSVRLNLPEHVKTLKAELETLRKELTRLHKQFPATQWVVVRSNHDEHLDRYIEEQKFFQDDTNIETALQLAQYVYKQKNPLEEYFKKDFPDILWLRRDEDFILADVHLGYHGDKGPGGSRGSIQNLSATLGNCIIGHNHAPGILYGAYRVGTTSILDMDYAKGAPSNWMHTSAILYPNGQRTLIHNINGRYRL